MGANGSYDKDLDMVPEESRTHEDTGYKILGHKVLLQEAHNDQVKNVMNSNSSDPVYLIAKTESNGNIKIVNIDDFGDHKIGYEVNLKFDSNGNLLPYNGKESHSHAHTWCQAANGDMHRAPVEGNSHLPIPSQYYNLINQIVKFNKENNKYKK